MIIRRRAKEEASARDIRARREVARWRVAHGIRKMRRGTKEGFLKCAWIYTSWRKRRFIRALKIAPYSYYIPLYIRLLSTMAN